MNLRPRLSKLEKAVKRDDDDDNCKHPDHLRCRQWRFVMDGDDRNGERPPWPLCPGCNGGPGLIMKIAVWPSREELEQTQSETSQLCEAN